MGLLNVRCVRTRRRGSASDQIDGLIELQMGSVGLIRQFVTEIYVGGHATEFGSSCPDSFRAGWAAGTEESGQFQTLPRQSLDNSVGPCAQPWWNLEPKS